MRVVIGALWHETNTFSPVVTGSGSFRADRRAEPTLRHVVEAASVAAGAAGATLETVYTAWAPSSGPVPRDVFECLVRDLVTGVQRAEPVDGVVLVLSGALVVDGEDDGDARVVELVRDAVGREMPIGVIVGPRANLSRRLVNAATLVIGLDGEVNDPPRVSGLLQTLTSRRTPSSALVKLPLLIHPEAARSAAFAALCAWAHRARHSAGVRETMLVAGFPFGDTDYTGASVLVYAESPDQASRVAGRLAAEVWAARAGLVYQAENVEVAVHAAMASRHGPTLLLDAGDDAALGGPSDGTALLWAMLDLGVERAVLGIVHDPAAVAGAATIGPGGRVRLSLGARADRRHGYPIEIDAVVERIGDGVRRGWDRASDGDECVGRMAVLRVTGRHDGAVDVVVSERRLDLDDPGVFTSLDLDVTAYRIVALKGGSDTRTALGLGTYHAIPVATPGVTVPDFAYHDYRKIPRPIYPLDEI